MKRRVWTLLMVVIAAVYVSGCAEMRDKFIRKPKEEEPVKRFYSVREYDVKPSLDLYTKRYIFWKSWHRELLEVINGTNHKKMKVAVEQEVSNLIDMRTMLVDEKAEELQKLIDELTGIEKTIKTERVTQGNRVRIRRQLELLGKQVKREFSYREVRGMIRDEFKYE